MMKLEIAAAFWWLNFEKITTYVEINRVLYFGDGISNEVVELSGKTRWTLISDWENFVLWSIACVNHVSHTSDDETVNPSAKTPKRLIYFEELETAMTLSSRLNLFEVT